MYELVREGTSRSRDFNRKDIFSRYQLYKKSGTSETVEPEYFLVLNESDENQGMTIANCPEMHFSALIEDLDLEAKAVRFFEHSAESASEREKRDVFDEVTFGEISRSRGVGGASGKIVCRNPEWRRAEFAENEISSFIEPNAGYFQR